MKPTPLDDAVALGYPLGLRSLLVDARRVLKGSKRVLIVGGLSWLAISTVVASLTLGIGLGTAPSAALGVLATAPLTVGLVMAGARRAAGWPIAFDDLWAYRHVTANAAVVLLVNLAVALGADAALGPIASVPLSVAYGLFTSLALYLVADRGMGAGRALLTSALLVRHRWGTLLLLQVVLGALLGLAVLPFGLGLIWAGPFAILALGGVYVKAVGLAAGAPAGTGGVGGAP